MKYYIIAGEASGDLHASNLMMELKNPVKVEDYLDQVVHYLGMINSGTVQKVVKN